MSGDQLAGLDATGQAALVRQGEVKPVELVEAAIARIEQANPAINAVISTNFDRARDLANADPGPEGPFGGVPFLLKDLGATQAGLTQWRGNRAFKEANLRSAADTELGARFRRAGLITLGQTNTPELGSSPSTQPLSCGPTNNPWDTERSPSGSSGGSAAAVAAGMVPMAHANDGGGSIRLPAAWCGLVGLKPSRGRIPNPENTSRMVTELVVSRTVRDTANLYRAVKGATEADLFHIADRGDRQAEMPSGRLRIALVTDGGAVAVDEACVEAAEAAARVLDAMGNEVVPVPYGEIFADAAINGQIWMARLAGQVAALAEVLGRPLREGEVDPYNWAAAQRAARMSAAEVAALEADQQAWVSAMVARLQPYDLLVTPTSASMPMRTAHLEPPADKPWKISTTYARIGLFTIAFNATGQPAISLPVHQDASGLPAGAQLVAGLGQEELLLRLAGELEGRIGWAGRSWPGESAGTSQQS